MMQDLTKLRDEVTDWQRVSQRLTDALLLAEMGDEELGAELQAELDVLSQAIAKLEFRALFAGKYDDEINRGLTSIEKAQDGSYTEALIKA